ncbi:MAG: hypothetical protein JKY37_12895 [Nannocystaceae bacterium]|nr:hypothetical protein [Nannocystaceae bacterium]
MRRLSLMSLVALLACDSASDATDASKKAAADAVAASKQAVDTSKKIAGDAAEVSAKAVDASKKAIDASKQAVDSTTKAATEAIDAGKKAAEGTKQWWADIPDTGALSEQTTVWLSNAAKQGGRSIENLLIEGETYAPAAMQIGSALASSVNGDSGFEPIYVKVSDRDDADAKIGDMPKVQVVDNLTIGLKRVDSWEGLTQKKERGYLVLWREDDHLIGFVYRSRREIDLAKVATEVPHLISLVRRSMRPVDSEYSLW